MKRVNIGDLKAKLSAHLKLVRKGEQLLVCDRDLPIARIIPYRAEDYSEEMQDLIARGIITPPRRIRPASHQFPIPKGKVISQEVMDKVWEEEREDR